MRNALGKHPGDEASGMRGARGKRPSDKASGMRGARGKHPGDEASRLRGARRIDWAFLSRLAFGPGPIRALGQVGLLMELGPSPWYPQCPPFSFRGERLSSVGKRNKLNRRCMGNSRQSMMFNVVQCEFYNFLELH